jgi:hypothetical protein
MFDIGIGIAVKICNKWEKAIIGDGREGQIK